MIMEGKIIDAGKLLGAIRDDHSINGANFARIKRHINEAPAVQKWIPVSERLPEEPGHFLVVVKERYDFENDYSYDTDVAHYRLDGGYIDGCWDTFVDWDEGQPYLHVTHWMPLPMPPKGE